MNNRSNKAGANGAFKLGLVSGAVALALGAAPALAGTSVANLFFPGLNQLSDNSAEILIKGTGNTGASAHCTGIAAASCIEVGDRFRGIMEFETIEDLGGGGGTRNFGVGGPGAGTTTVNALNGIFDITVHTITGGGANFFFAPTAGFAASVGASAGTMIALFDDTSNNYGRTFGDCLTTAACEALASGGSLFATFGFGQDAGAANILTGGQGDELWATFGGFPDYSLFAQAAAGTGLGSVNVQVSLIDNFTGLQFGQVSAGLVTGTGDGLITANGTGNVIGIGTGPAGCGGVPLGGPPIPIPCTATNTPYGNWDNIDITVNVTSIPEPGTVALLGLGLLGIGVVSRRKLMV